MTQTKKKYLKISKGQIAPELVERTDIGLLDDSGQTITNFYDTKYGALKSVPGTKSVVKWNGDVKARMLKVILPNNNDGFIIFNGTSHTMQLFNHLGQAISEEISCQYITTNNLYKLQIAQQSDLCLLCTTTTPLIRLDVKINSLSWSIFSIPYDKILKYSSGTSAVLTPNIFRAVELSNSISSFPVIIDNSATPPTGSVTVYNLEREEDPNAWEITSAKIKSYPASRWSIRNYSVSLVGQDYNVGDVVMANGLTFTITGYSALAATITLVDPQESYDTNKAGSFPAIGGSGSGMAITITTDELQYKTGDILTIKGTQWEINNLGIGEELVAIDEGIFQEDPAGEDVPAEGGSYHDMTVDLESDILRRKYTSSTYTLQEADTLQDLFDTKKIWQYLNNAWYDQDTSNNDVIINNLIYGLDAIQTGSKARMRFVRIVVRGFINNYYFDEGVSPIYFTEAANSSEQAIERFRSRIVGSTVSANDGNMGIMKVTSAEIGGATRIEEGKYSVALNAISGILQVGFVDGSTHIDHFNQFQNPPKRSLKFEFSYIQGFSGDFPGTKNNPSTRIDFPQSILFYQQRLFIGGTTQDRQQILASKLAEYDNFAADESNVKDAFQLIISSNKKEIIQHLFLNQGIQVFCKDSEWIINSQQISSSSGFLKNSDIGSNEVYPSLSANGITLFVPQNGKGIISFSYNYEQANYSTPYISLFTNLLNTEIKDLYLKKGQSSEEDTLLLICNVDGDLIIGNYLVDHEIQAFCRRHEEHTKFLQCIECEDNVFMLTQRNNNTTLEILDKTASTSLETTTGFSISSGKITLTDTRYCNQLINTYDSNGDFIEQIEIDNNGEGAVTKETQVAKVGINIHSTFESNPLNYSIETYNEYKNIRQFKIVLPKNPKGKFVTVNKKFPRRKDNFWEYYRVARPQRDCRFKVENDIYPCEILSFEIDLEV